MKKRFAHFLVTRSRVILIIFILLALGCGALIPLVNVNHDMTEYLPKDSAMRHGLDLMRAEFGEEESSSLEVMFDDLDSDQARGQVLQELEAIPHVESVDYEPPGEDEDGVYNRDGYTRFILNCDYEQYSQEAKGIWTAVQETFGEEHGIELGGSINDACETGLPLWIALTAVGMVALILLIMASSWIEPLAFLITIGVAVLINMGTYCLFPSISNTTFGIVALLQLVLSMDYSIMLLNRYRQVRSRVPDKKDAMEEALALSFGAITGSSLTTFAGLLALLFMSFTMGADIGMALAKGVLISLICIFTVLPALLLWLDGLMLRTVKKTFPFDLPRLSAAQARLRVPLTLLFVALFVGGLLFRGGVDFTYSQAKDSEIDRVFGHTNTIVMMYDEKDGEAAGELAATLDEREDVRSAVCYESTLGKQRDVADMREFIEDMKEEADSDSGSKGSASGSGGESGSDGESDSAVAGMDLSDSMLRLIYYDYHTSDPDIRLTIPAFVSYLQDDVLEDPDFSDAVSSEARDRIDEMEKYTDRKALTTPMNASGLASFFGMKKSQVKQLLLYYKIKHGGKGTSMSLPRFVSFLIDDVATDPDYGSMMSASQRKQLQSMRIYTNKKKMKKKRAWFRSAYVLKMDEGQMRLIYAQHYAKAGVSSVRSIADLALVLGSMAEDPLLADTFGTEQMAQLIAGLTMIGQMDPTPYDIGSMAQVLAGYGIPLDEATLTTVYAYGDLTLDPKIHMVSVQEIVHFMLKEKSIRDSMSKKQRKQLKRLRGIIDASVSGKRLSAKKTGKLLSMKASDVNKIYLLHQYKYGDTRGWKLTPQKFIHFLVSTVLKDKSLKGRVGEHASDLKAAKKLIDAAVAGKEYTYRGLADLLDEFRGSSFGEESDGEAEDTRETGSDDSGSSGAGGSDSGNSGGVAFDSDDLAVLYEMYGSEHDFNENWTMDLVQMVTHLDENMIARPAFAKAMEEDQKEDVHELREDMDEAAELLEGSHYGRLMITAEMDEDSDETRAFMGSLEEATDQSFAGETYFIGNTPMAWEMSQSFRGELNRITLITALFIFIIVLVTFRRMMTPVILVLIIQCAVFMTMALMSILRFDMHYLALLIVQSIMMGATIDYAIIFCSYYVESRGGLEPQEAIRASFRGSLQTIMTSALILTLVAGLLSFAFSDPATGQICRILSVGCLIATLLVIFILPAILACLDRAVVKKKKG